MLLDGVAYLGNWPFRKLRYNTAESMLERMDRCGIDGAVVSSLNAVLYKDVMNGNCELAEAVKGLDRFIPLAVINPAYPHWKEDFLYCLDELGMKGLEIFPGYHNYSLDLPELKELLTLAAQRKVPVRVPGRLVDIRGRHWMDTPENLSGSDLEKIVKLSPETDILICSCNTASVSKLLEPMAKERPGKILYDFSQELGALLLLSGVPVPAADSRPGPGIFGDLRAVPIPGGPAGEAVLQQSAGGRLGKHHL